MNFLKSIKTLTIIGIVLSNLIQAQLPSKVLVGYWHNWETLRIKDVDDRYNVISLSFLEADKNNSKDDNSINDLEFTPYNATQLKNDIPIVQADGKKVIISIGGANGSFKLRNTTDKNTFVTKVKNFITEYNVDGIDIDIERTIYICQTGNHSMSSPAIHIQYLIDGVKELLTWYQSTYNKKMILTTAPEVSYTTGALSPWNSCNGAFLPFIEQLRDDIDLLMIQLYNSGSIYSLPGYSANNSGAYNEGTEDFVITTTEAAIEGFTPKNTSLTGTYSGLPANKIVVALPACANAGSGYLTPTKIKNAVKYLMGTGSKPGSYTLSNSYPTLRGLMTWSINNDAKSTCGGTYTFAQAFEDIYGTIDNHHSISEIQLQKLNIYPNPSANNITIDSKEILGETLTIIDFNGRVVKTIQITTSTTTINIGDLSNGFYTAKSALFVGKIILKK